MTLEQASNIYYINKEIERIQKDLSELESKRTYLKSMVYSDMPTGGSRVDPNDEYLQKHKELTDMLAYSLKHLQMERVAFERFLETVQDAEMRLILRLRCINNMTYRQIGEEMNMSKDTAWRKFMEFWQNRT